ncbi:MAG: helix-turn-helix transcriptional regulator [Anaerotignum sp.]|nr:helix-turn-helix transcriptional regulator [Anaerotignum sp.]
MDQIKIGKFITSCRKEQGMTQANLAEKLGISDRAVSKWETGKSMPDSGIILELCAYLKISVNELFSGERIESEDYTRKAEENMIILAEKKAQAKKHLFRTKMFLLVIAVLIFPLHLAINYYYLDNITTGMGEVVIIAGIILYVHHFRKYFEIRLK